MNDLIVKFKDGRTGFVSVLDLPVLSLSAWIGYAATGNTVALVGLCIGHSQEFVESLSVESLKELAQLSIKSHFDRAVDFAETDLFAGAKLWPMLKR